MKTKSWKLERWRDRKGHMEHMVKKRGKDKR